MKGGGSRRMRGLVPLLKPVTTVSHHGEAWTAIPFAWGARQARRCTLGNAQRLRIVSDLGRVGLHDWCQALHHSGTIAAFDAASKAGIALEKGNAQSPRGDWRPLDLR
jgi:hypothetical protein